MPTAAEATLRPRLEHIGALRGLSALAVVLVHAFEIYNLGLPDIGDGTGGLTDSAMHVLIRSLYEWFFQLGALAVPIFIMLSGYSLMIPVARSDQSMRTPQHLRTFFVRRVRRILPPYYVAMALSLLIIAVVPSMGTPANVYWDRALRDLGAMNIVAHLLLVHNLNGDWGSAINPPFWSLPIEWQIYFLFPLLVLLWRRLGLMMMFLLTSIYVAIPSVFGIVLLPFTNVSFVLLFAIGMAGAMINFAPGAFELRLRNQLPWWRLALAGLLVLFVMQLGRIAFGLPIRLMSLVAGMAILALVVACTKDQLSGRETRIGRALSHSSLTWLGLFSYSLYLVHMPILAMFAAAARALSLSTTMSYLLVLLVGIPVALLLAYGFHLVFERPFLHAPAPKPYTHAVPDAPPRHVIVPGEKGGS